jgi:hypothetical protein
VAGEGSEPLRVEDLGVFDPGGVLSGGEVGVAVGAIADRPEMIGREATGTGRRSDGGQLGQRDSLSKPASQVGASRPRTLRRPRYGGQGTVRRPPVLLLKALEQAGGQRVHGIQQLFGSKRRHGQLITCNPGHI